MINRLSTTYSTGWVYLFVLFACLAYALPWLSTSAAATTNNAHDLAEWASLHPASYATNPALLTSLLIRLQLVLLVAVMSIRIQKHFNRSWWITAGGMILLFIAQLPPIEFINNMGDLNYQQQLLLSGSSLLIGILGLTGRLFRFRQEIGLLIAIIACISSWMAVTQAQELYEQFQISSSIGLGVISQITLYAMLGLYSARKIYQRVNGKTNEAVP